MNKAKIIAGIGLLGLLGSAGYYLWKSKQGRFYYAGTIEATRIDVPARLASVIATVAAHEGQKVEAGEGLVQLACEDVRIQADLLQGNYERGLRLVKAGSMPQKPLIRLKRNTMRRS